MNLYSTIEFARIAHGEQKYGKLPYYFHLSEVLSTVGEYTTDFHLYQAALFHDIFEDTDVTPQELLNHGVDEEVIEIVKLCTDPDGKNRKERKIKLYFAMKNYPEGRIKTGASIVKLSDRFVNQRNSLIDRSETLKMYVNEYDEFMTAFVVKNTPLKLVEALHNQYEEIKEYLLD